MRMIAFLIALSTCAAVCSVVQAARPADLVKPAFIADVAAIKAGEPFKVGVLLKLKPKWHVYWKYPGDSGSATRVQFTAPQGWQVSGPQFPIPKRFAQPGDIVGYGYEDEVMLIATVTPPADAKSAGPVELAAKVDWLACTDVCIPGKAELKLSLPVGEAAQPANAEQFKAWLDRMPASESPAIRNMKVVRSDGRFVASVTLDQPCKDVQWFPNPPRRTGVSDASVKTVMNDSSLWFDLIPSPQTSIPIEFLVIYTSANGNRRGVEFTVNLPPASQPQSGS